MRRRPVAALALLTTLISLSPLALASEIADYNSGTIELGDSTVRIDGTSYTDGTIKLTIHYDLAAFSVPVFEPTFTIDLTAYYFFTSGLEIKDGIWKLSSFRYEVTSGGKPYIDLLFEEYDALKIKWEWNPFEVPKGWIFLTFTLENPSSLSSELLAKTKGVLKIPNFGSEQTVFFLDFNPDDGDGGCPTLFVWNGADFVEDELIGIHAESDVVRAVTLNAEPALVNGSFYALKLSELAEGFNYSESRIDQVRLIALVWEGGEPEFKACELIYAEHSSLGAVTRELRRSDDVRVATVKGEEIILVFKAPKDSEKAEAFALYVEGHNPVKL